MKTFKLLCLFFVCLATVWSAEAQTARRWSVGLGCGIVDFAKLNLDGAAYSPLFWGVQADYNWIDTGGNGSVSGGIEYKRIDGQNNLLGSYRVDCDRNIIALRGRCLLGSSEQLLNLYLGCAMGLTVEFSHTYGTDSDGKTIDSHRNTRSPYGRAFAGLRLRVLRNLHLYCEAGLPTEQLQLGATFQF
ncbi:MAG: hypothetical protein SOZ00_01555 [Tidjanibacter sp.]|nr:hypothetical protein [Tidjanibacter sp.]